MPACGVVNDERRIFLIAVERGLKSQRGVVAVDIVVHIHRGVVAVA